MKRAVLKFGGSSVATIDKMKAIADKLEKRIESKDQIVVVVSAMGKTTNGLLDLAKEASKNPSKRELDLLVSTGEQVSISLLTMILKDRGRDAIALTGFQAGIKTAGLHTKNTITDIDIEHVEAHLNQGRIVVVAGFQGINDLGDITTLGRGGSDTTAVALAAKLKCSAEIYTDVEGIYGVDPRLYKNAKKMDYVSYEEMKELAFLGAKVMEPRSIEIGERFGVPIYVASTHSDAVGTWIVEGKNMEQKRVSGVSTLDNILVVSIKHLPRALHVVSDIFIELAKAEVNVDMITQGISTEDLVNLTFTVSTDDTIRVQEILDQTKEKYPESTTRVIDDVAKLSVVGEGMRTQSGVAAELFALLSDHDIAYRMVTTSDISISFTLNKDVKEKAVHIIAEHFGL